MVLNEPTELKSPHTDSSAKHNQIPPNFPIFAEIRFEIRKQSLTSSKSYLLI